MEYETLTFKIPVESNNYSKCSKFVVKAVDSIIKDAMDSGRNKIIISTNLKLGIPMENVNKIAGPFVEAWAHEVFYDVLEDNDNKYRLVNVEAGSRLNMADIILQFKHERKRQSSITGDISGSGKSPNITSYARIRSAYIEDPDYLFVILSIKHKVSSCRDAETGMTMGIMEVVDFNAYDLKYLSVPDISYNPALGTGQLQVRDIHYVTIEERSVWEFCQLLDKKCIASKGGFTNWLRYAKKYKWIKE